MSKLSRIMNLEVLPLHQQRRPVLDPQWVLASQLYPILKPERTEVL